MTSVAKKFSSIISISEITSSLLKISLISLLLGILLVIFDNSLFFVIEDRVVPIRKEIFLAFIGLSATLVGFLISSSAIISSFSTSGILEKAIENNTFTEIIDYMYITKKVYIVLFVASIVGLFLDSYADLCKFILYFLIIFAITAISLTIYSIKILESVTKISILERKREIEEKKQQVQTVPSANLNPQSDGFNPLA